MDLELVILGGGLAGCLAAHALSPYFKKMANRDQAPAVVKAASRPALLFLPTKSPMEGY